MTPDITESLRETRAEVAALRRSLREGTTELWLLTIESAGAGFTPDERAAICYAADNIRAADRGLTTALLALRPLLDPTVEVPRADPTP